MPFDSASVHDLMKSIQIELTAVEKKLGVKLTVGRASYSATVCTVKVEAALPASDGAAPDTKMASDFRRCAGRWGLKDDDLHKTFMEGGKKWKIVGLLPRASSSPIVCQNEKGTEYKFPADRVRNAIGNQPANSGPKGKRSDEEIIEALRDVECQLSPGRK